MVMCINQKSVKARGQNLTKWRRVTVDLVVVVVDPSVKSLVMLEIVMIQMKAMQISQRAQSQQLQ